MAQRAQQVQRDADAAYCLDHSRWLGVITRHMCGLLLAAIRADFPRCYERLARRPRSSCALQMAFCARNLGFTGLRLLRRVLQTEIRVRQRI